MSWHYGGNPTVNNLDRVRFIVGDTNINEPILQDEEIQYLITEYGSNENLLKFHLFTIVTTIFARDIKRSLGPQAEDPTERLKFFKEQLTYYRAKLLVAGVSLPTYAYPKIFRKGMLSNPPWPTTPGADYV